MGCPEMPPSHSHCESVDQARSVVGSLALMPTPAAWWVTKSHCGYAQIEMLNV